MDEAVVNAVKQSYGRSLGNHDLMNEFYDRLMASHADIARMFSGIDMRKQQAVLKQSLSMAILYPRDNLIATHAMERVRKSHARDRLNIRPELYKYWLDTLMGVVAESDPEFTPELEQQWRAVLSHTISFIAEGY
ncbi:hypothetical protein Tel_15150 [Candidatus Tenderia electrophaga]|jgi:hemoglobin-like flavoprotein|uniref:Globin domain-containing protein n=1 Tax=Candidatus Tenderia electrophaga TaxID=1748243 RepID=A0A0S2TGT5_9GAMM|nr:hypothetical protein Tel_15150 [Candidatus Tenderia electrophaga]